MKPVIDKKPNLYPREMNIRLVMTALILVLGLTLSACSSAPDVATRAGAEDIKLLELINAARTSGNCRGTPMTKVSALKWNDKLYKAANDHSKDMAFNGAWGSTGSDGSTLATRLAKHNYKASVQGQSISAGSSNAAGAFRQLSCSRVMDADFSELGAALADNPADDFRYYWTAVFAKPSSVANPTNPTNPEPIDLKAVLTETNKARAQGRDCGGDEGFMAAAPALTWDDRLAKAAQLHSQDMLNNNFFDHRGSNGSSIDQRVGQQGYAWSAVGENIQAGATSAAAVVASWLASPGHCENIMSPSFTQMGAGLAGSKWTQVFARPQ